MQMITTPQTMTEAIKMREQMEREDFAARVRGEHADDKAHRLYILGELRLAYRRAKLHAEAIREAAKMVEAGVDSELALSSIGDAMDYMIPTPPEERHNDIGIMT
jgi:hypothetical protein